MAVPAPRAFAPAEKRRVLLFFREDTPHMGRALAISAVLIASGGLCTLLGALARFSNGPPKLVLGVLGPVLLLCGLIRGFVLFPSVLWRERSLSVEREGLRFTQSEQEAEFLPWASIARIEGRPDELLVHFEEDDEPRRVLRSFGGKSFVELAQLLEACRRKAQFSIL